MALRRGIALADLSPTQVDLEAWLATPPQYKPVEALPPLWRHVVIRAVCARPPDCQPDVGLLNKVRGAMGEALLAGASPAARERLPCPWNPPCALDILFRQRAIRGVGAGAPPPYTLAVDFAGRQLRVSLSLFGVAAEACAAEVADALVRALRHGLDFEAGRRVALDVTHREIDHVDGVARRMPFARRIALRFVTPAAPRSDGVDDRDPAGIMRGMFSRVVGMARWYGVSVTDDADWLQDRLRAVLLDDSALSAGAPHYRLSANTPEGGYYIPVRTGSLAIAGAWQPLWPLLILGEATHAGGRATQGYGRYRIVAE